MTYIVTYRRQDGGRAKMAIDAANREELFAQLAERGVRAVSVAEGGRAAARGGGWRRWRRAAVGLAVGLAAAAGVWVAVGRRTVGGQPPAAAEAKRPAAAVRQAAEGPVAVREKSGPAAVAVAPAGPAPAEPKLKTYRDERGILRYEGGLRVPGQRPVAEPIQLGAHQPRIFKHDAEEHISWLLDMKIGEPVIGDYAYGERFRESFMASLNEPVEILETDDERTRELKVAVQETKEELRARMQSGEDVVRIMNDTMNEYRQLARYKHELQVQLSEIRADQEQYSDQDVQDFTSAANELLKRYGLPPLVFPRAIIRGLRE